MINSRSKRCVSTFDLDKTLLSVNSSYAFAKYLRKYGQFSLSDLAFVIYCTIKHQLSILSIEDVHHCAYERLFHGSSESYVNLWAKRFVADHLEELLYAPAVARLRLAQSEGHLTALLSSAPKFLVEPIAATLGIDRFLSTNYGVDKSGRFCKIENIVLGIQKAAFIRGVCEELGCSAAGVAAYSDSYHDIDYLRAAGIPVGVNPDRKLRSHCRKHGWATI